MSILKSTNSGQKLWWHKQLDELVRKVYGEVDSFPSGLWDLIIYYKVPIRNFTFQKEEMNHTTNYVRNKIIFNKKNTADIESIKNRILFAFGSDIYEPYALEDIPIDQIVIEIESV